jgi:hypothetical protein
MSATVGSPSTATTRCWSIPRESGTRPGADAANYLEDSRSLYQQIAPGEQLAARVVYDMPKRSTSDRIDLHASLFSLGVTVVLS